MARARGLQDPRLPSLPAPVLASWVFYQLRRQQGPRAAVHTGASVSCAHGDLSPPQLPGPGPDLRAHRPLPLPSAQGLWGRWPTLAGPTLGGAAGGAAGRSRPHSGAAMHSGWKPGWGARLVTWPGCSPHVSPAAASPAGCPATSPALPAVLAVPQRSRSACTLPAPEDNRHTPGGWAAGRGVRVVGRAEDGLGDPEPRGVHARKRGVRGGSTALGRVGAQGLHTPVARWALPPSWPMPLFQKTPVPPGEPSWAREVVVGGLGPGGSRWIRALGSVAVLVLGHAS